MRNTEELVLTVMVSAYPDPDEKGKYVIKVLQPDLPVAEPRQAISFEFDELTTPPLMKFTGFSPIDPARQICDIVVKDRRIDCIDINDQKVAIPYTLQVDDPQGNRYRADPQILNKPR
jgi:hypothetical protein